MTEYETYFDPFRRHIVGIDQSFRSVHGDRRIVYADWTASGRLYEPLERRIVGTFGPYVGNTHSESSVTGTRMTRAYEMARDIIKRHVNAGPRDVIITRGSGMTSAVCRFQRILGLRLAEEFSRHLTLPDERRPVVFVTHMEHHSNHTSWLETEADVVCMEPDERGLVDPDSLRELLQEYANRPLKIGAFTACSNVTGVRPPVRELATIMHENGGYCFVDYAASAPYVDIDMHPADPQEKLDAIFFSPHKFLGGPGSAGVLIFDADLYDHRVPDEPGGGTVDWTNPWGGRKYRDSIEAREDGGTPAFLQTIKAALCIRLKERMGVERMTGREDELRRDAFAGLRRIPGVHILADHVEDRQLIFSFYVRDVHYNLMVKLLNDRFGIQVRGGCSCAGTYGHYLLHVDPAQSRSITDMIDTGDLSEKPGWVRLSLHPTTTNAELGYILDAIENVVRSGGTWSEDYRYDHHRNEFLPLAGEPWVDEDLEAWFALHGDGR